MFFTALSAAAVPVIPFALFSLATARIVSLAVTFALLVLLGVGRASRSPDLAFASVILARGRLISAHDVPAGAAHPGPG